MKTKYCSLKIVLLVCCAVIITSCSRGDIDEKPPVEIDALFMFELPPNKTTAAVYAKLTNHSDVMQRLNYIHSPLAEHVEVHRSAYENGMMQMRQVKRLSLTPGETKSLSPGSFHLMVFGLYDPLKVGDRFEMTFEFETGHVITTQVEVRSPG